MKIAWAFVCAAVAFLNSGAANANLITNPTFSGIGTLGTNDEGGWDFLNDSGANAGVGVSEPGGGFVSGEGGEDAGTVEQLLQVVPGKTYQMDFFLIGSESNSGDFTVRFGNTAGFTSSKPIPDKLTEYRFDAVALHPIQVFGLNGENMTGTVWIFNPSVTAVPEPSTWVMALLGFAGLGFVGHSRTKRGRSSAPAVA